MQKNKINNISWQEAFKEIKDGSIDLVITSPPYNLGGKFHTGNKVYDKAYNEYDDNLPEDVYQEQQVAFLDACYDKLKDSGSLFYNHKPRIKNGICIHPLEWVLKSKFILKQEIIWKNRSQNFDKIRFYPFTERVYWLVKTPKTKLYNELGLSDIWEFKNSKRHKEHNATFCIDLPYTIIKSFKEAGVIIDPYGGIGTTIKAALQVNKEDNRSISCYGFEIDKKYCDIGNKEIDLFLSSLSIDKQ